MRIAVHLASCLVLGVLLSGCGGGGTNTTTGTSSAASVPSATAPQRTASTPSPPSRPVTPQRTSAHLSAAAKGFLVEGADNSIPEYGSEASASERESVGAVLSSFLEARAKGEWSRACTELASPLRKQLERLSLPAKAKAGTAGSCSRALGTFSGGRAVNRADPLIAGVAVLRVSGAVAFALFHGPHHGKYLITMRSEGGAWKVNQIAPEPYPLGTSATP